MELRAQTRRLYYIERPISTSRQACIRNSFNFIQHTLFFSRAPASSFPVHSVEVSGSRETSRFKRRLRRPSGGKGVTADHFSRHIYRLRVKSICPLNGTLLNGTRREEGQRRERVRIIINPRVREYIDRAS